MDYGQPVKTDDNQPFFTAEDGVDASKNPNSAPDDNLNLNNWDVSANRDPRGIGSNVISSVATNETQPGLNPNLQESPTDNQTLGEVVNLSMPPGSIPDDSVEAPQANLAPQITEEIKTEEKLSSGAIKAIDAAINQLSDGNISSFYDNIRGEGGLRDQNLKNSFGREIGKAA